MKKNYLLIILGLLLLVGCSSGKNRLEKGDYDTAVYQAVKRLNQKPNHTKAEKVLREAYTLAVGEHMQTIEYLDMSDGVFKYDRMSREYELINYLNNAIRRYPQYAGLVQLTDVREEMAFVKKQAAIAHHEEGRRLLQLNSKQHARNAYFQFLDANTFVQGFVPAAEIANALEAGTVNIAVEFAQSTRFYRNYDAERVYDRVMNNLNHSRYRFMRMVQLGSSDIEPDEIVQIELDQARVGRMNFSERKVVVQKDNVHLGEIETDSGKVEQVYGTVTADFIEYCKNIHTNTRMMVQRVDGNSLAVINRREIPSSFHWSQKWATYRGDKRALNDAQLKLANQREPRAPSPDWLLAKATEPLTGQGVEFIFSQYRHLR